MQYDAERAEHVAEVERLQAELLEAEEKLRNHKVPAAVYRTLTYALVWGPLPSEDNDTMTGPSKGAAWEWLEDHVEQMEEMGR
jgi:hypothetical protein